MGSFGLFCLSFIRIYGQSAMVVGNLLGVVLVLALDRPLPSLSATGMVAASFLGGGLWATLLTMVVWRIHPYAPARRAVAEVYRQLALLVAGMRDLVRADRPPAAAWEAHARAHRRSVREAIEQARATVFDAVRVRGPVSPRAAQGLIRLEAADQLFGALIALSDVLEHTKQPLDRKIAGRGLRRLGPLLRNLGRSIGTDETGSNPAIARSIGAFSREAGSLPPGQPLQAIFETMVERLQIAATLSVPANFMPGGALGGERSSALERIGRPLRANLSWDSLALRHALRVAIVAAPAIAITLFHYAPYQHWLTITMVLTMQPYFATTIARALERIGGTGPWGRNCGALRGRLRDTPGNYGSVVPVDGDCARRPAGQFRDVHDGRHANCRAAIRDRPAWSERMDARWHAWALYRDRRPFGPGRVPRSLAKLGAQPARE